MSSAINQSSVERGHAFKARLEDLVREMLLQHHISCYRIESLLDIAVAESGEPVCKPVIRVVTYFEDNIRKVADLVKTEFEIVGDVADNSQIGQSYQPMHSLATLTAARLELPEYRRIGNLQFEIQVTSILQDAWRGMELGLGLRPAAYPESLKRDLARVGAWLEMVDVEFTKMKASIPELGTADTIAPENAAPVAMSAPQVVAVTDDYFYEESIAPVAQPAPAYRNLAYNYLSNGNAQPATVKPATAVADLPVQVPAVTPEAVIPTVSALPLVEEEPTVVEQPVAQIDPVEELEILPETDLAAGDHISEHLFPEYTLVSPLEPANELSDGAGIAADGKVTLSTLDMNIARPENLAMQVGNVEAGDDESMVPGLMAAADSAMITAFPINDNNNQPQATNTVNEAVALNIDNVEMFNLNVNGIVETRTEVLVDRDKDKNNDNIPFFERVEKVEKPLVLEEGTLLSDAALREYVATSSLVKEVDAEIARRAGAVLNSDVDVEGDVERLKYLKVFTLKQLHERIGDNKADVVAFAEKWIGTDNGGSFDSGICLFYLEYLLVGKRNDPAFAVEYVLKFISDNDYSARFIIPTYNSISKTDIPIASHLTLK